MADFKKNEFGQYKGETPKHLRDVLVGRFCRLRYEPLTNRYYNQTLESENLKQYSDLHIKKEIQDFDKVKERMKQKIIASDKSKDNTFVYTALSQFKKNNE